jgi:predicted metal-binding protein
MFIAINKPQNLVSLLRHVPDMFRTFAIALSNMAESCALCSNPRIERCRMDGTERSTIVNTDIEWPNGMSIGKYIN